MKNILFFDKQHVDRYYELIHKMKKYDVYHQSMAYLISLCDSCYNHANDIFDFKESVIVPEGLQEAWQTSTSLKVTRLAFNLWNHFCFDGDDMSFSCLYSADEIFSCDLAKYFFEAIRIRYPEYFSFNINERLVHDTEM
ncbi:MAG: hypothetical protein E7505_05255 [Ruminococcus sp.]|nr:hypothetical protein [Ruminococcus sp.]